MYVGGGHVWTPEVTLGCCSSGVIHPVFCFGTGSLADLNLADLAGLASQSPRDPPVSISPGLGLWTPPGSVFTWGLGI